jgi:hypothetical protein
LTAAAFSAGFRQENSKVRRVASNSDNSNDLDSLKARTVNWAGGARRKVVTKSCVAEARSH